MDHTQLIRDNVLNVSWYQRGFIVWLIFVVISSMIVSQFSFEFVHIMEIVELDFFPEKREFIYVYAILRYVQTRRVLF